MSFQYVKNIPNLLIDAGEKVLKENLKFNYYDI